MTEKDDKIAKKALDGIINNVCNVMYLNMYLHTKPNHSIYGTCLMIKREYGNEVASS